MTESIVVETSIPTERLSRKNLPDLVRALKDIGCGATCSWNVVEAAEILIDAGQFLLLKKLSERVAELLDTDGRGRLFAAYSAYCEIFTLGSLRKSLLDLERISSQLEICGHSSTDLVRAGTLRARAIVAGVAMGCLAAGELEKARQILATELDRAFASQNYDLVCQVGVEIAKIHCFPLHHDSVSANAVLSMLMGICDAHTIHSDLQFDIHRLHFQVASKQPLGLGHAPVSAQQLREEGTSLGSINQGLVELTLARQNPAQSNLLTTPQSEEILETIHALFSDSGYLLGAFEVARRRAAGALREQHLVRATKWYSAALNHCQEGSYLYGSLLSLLGLFQCSISHDQEPINVNTTAHLILQQIATLCTSELALAAMGLNLSAAYQRIDAFKEAGIVASRCEKFFSSRGLSIHTSNAASALGACLAGQNDWVGARKAWQRSLNIEQQLGTGVSTCEKKIAVAQAIVMHEFTNQRSISMHLIAKVEQILNEAEERLSECVWGEEHARTKGKLLQTHAQLYVLAKQPLEALKHLSRARSTFLSIAAKRDVALIDALSGMALLEVAKLGTTAMYDEAAAALHRALDFFNTREESSVRWKLKYYLSVAAYMSSQTKLYDTERMHWLNVAASWLSQAVADVETSSSASGLPSSMVSNDVDFSPGLAPDALEPLKKALGFQPAGIVAKSSIPKKATKTKSAKVEGTNAKAETKVKARRVPRHLH